MSTSARWFLLVLLLASSGVLRAQPGEGGAPAALTFPPEWEPHEAVWMGWSALLKR